MNERGYELYRSWAPDDVQWTQWVKPVLFANFPGGKMRNNNIPKLKWIHSLEYSTAIIVDLPGRESVLEGLALANLGYRPIPLYNSVCSYTGSSASVPIEGIIEALAEGVGMLNSAPLCSDSPPVFLLDANRMKSRYTVPGSFDNRWSVFPQDMPSAAYLKSHGISHVIVRSALLEEDLSHILLRYKNEGIDISISDGNAVRVAKVNKPPRYRSVLYRFHVLSGLQRNMEGGFGVRVPEDLRSTGGGYYRYG